MGSRKLRVEIMGALDRCLRTLRGSQFPSANVTRQPFAGPSASGSSSSADNRVGAPLNRNVCRASFIASLVFLAFVCGNRNLNVWHRQGQIWDRHATTTVLARIRDVRFVDDLRLSAQPDAGQLPPQNRKPQREGGRNMGPN